MTGGTIQIQTTNASGVPASEWIATLKGTSTAAIVENGSALGPIQLGIGTGANDYRGLFAGTIRDGGAGALELQVRRRANQTLSGSNTYSGQSVITNFTGAGYTRLLVDGSHIGGGAYSVGGSAAGNYAALGGKGIISASVVNLTPQGVLTPGGGLSATAITQDNQTATFTNSPGMLAFSNAVNLTDASCALEVDLSGTTPGTGHDQVVITGSGTFSNNNANLVIALGLGYTPAGSDKFTLVQVQGTSPANNIGVFTSLNGVATDLSQGATFTVSGVSFKISYRAEGATFDAGAGNGNDVMLEALASSAANLTWRGNGTDNNWDVITTADWWNGISLTTFTNGDNVTFDNTGTNNLPVNLVGDLNPNKVNVNATNDYTLAGAGKLTGTIVMTKTNTGRFVIATDNDFVGGTTISGGTLQVGTNSTVGTLPGTVIVSAGGVLEHQRSDDQVLTSLSGAGLMVHSGAGQLTVTNDLSAFTGTVSNTASTFQLGNGTTAGNGGKVGGPLSSRPARRSIIITMGPGTLRSGIPSVAVAAPSTSIPLAAFKRCCLRRT